MSSSLTKRKLDDYADESASVMTLSPTRMRKDEIALTANASSSSASAFSPPVLPSPRSPDCACVHFFVRMLPANTLVIHAHPWDTVESIHRKILRITGIPLSEQGLIYRGKQLQWEQTLADCNVEKDANLHLIGRMRSTRHPQAWQLLTDVVYLVIDLLKNNSVLSPHTTLRPSKSLKSMLLEFLTMTPVQTEEASEHLQIFNATSAPTVLVMLYASSHKSNKDMAEDAIRQFISLSKSILTSTAYAQFAPIVLELCRSLKKATEGEDRLYCLCRSSLGTVIEDLKFTDELISLHDVFPFFNELAVTLSDALALSLEPNSSILLPIGEVVSDFLKFVVPMRNAIEKDKCFCCPVEICRIRGYCRKPFRYPVEMFLLYGIFDDLLSKLDMCLLKIEDLLKLGAPNGGILPVGHHYLAILKELNAISKLYPEREEVFWETMKQRKDALCYLIVRDAKSSDDHKWLHDHKEVTSFEARRHLAMMLLPEVKDEFEEMYEMLIDRANLLSESFEYIGRADAESLRAGLFMEFKNEEATGPGVLREWFFLVCQEIFNPHNALFVACPNDRRRFFPNPASKVDPMHLEYFKFSGRIIALALMHKVQLGIVFDRLFFLLLSDSGHSVTLEDIRVADPYLYSSCKQILEMDSEAVDQDTLGLTFVHEMEQLGTREVTELCTDGRNIAVNSKNRGEYVKSLIKHRFVTSTEKQVKEFERGFADIMSPGHPLKSFFQCLDPEDLDSILYGSEKEICVDDWRAHTEYHGFKETDAQVSWFWKIVGSMTAEQKRVLLFFWTSMKYLPVEGFRGLASLLYIYKISESDDRLPSSHTCFYRLCFPAYPTFSAMHARLHIIVQEHVGCSFGTW